MNPVARLFVVVLLALFGSSTQAQSLTVIDLKHRTAEEVLPLLQPLVSSEVALTGVDYRLLVRGNADEVARIREALAVLDRAPKQMLVSVRYATQTEMANEYASVSGRLSTKGSNLTPGAGRDSESRNNSNISSVRVLEGQSAYVSSGTSVPMISAALISRNVTGVAIDERSVSSGFEVLPRVNGETVILEVGTQNESVRGGRSGNQIDTQRVSTSVMGKVGQWLTLGGVDESSTTRSSTIGSRRIETASDQRQIWLKVELIAD
jgi:type II secretory pathway component GspD/PulD (secretin)